MLRQGAARPSFSTSRSETFHQVSASGVRPRTTSGHESDPEDYVPPPPKANIGDLLAQALEMSTLKEEGAAPAKVSKKGKKMKGQKICLTGGGPRTSMNWTDLLNLRITLKLELSFTYFLSDFDFCTLRKQLNMF